MKRLILMFPLLGLAGCVVHEHRDYVRVREPEVVVEEPVGPVVEQAEVVEVLPPPAERVYIYEPGYPPGVFFYGGFIYYGGHRYERDVFVDRFVSVNIRNHRFVDVEYNRRIGRQYEVRHREEFVRYHGHRPHEEHRYR